METELWEQVYESMTCHVTEETHHAKTKGITGR